jgi:hypothetical protein
MQFIQIFLAQSESASPEATTLYVYNMSLFLVACLLNRWQRASSAWCLQNKARDLAAPRSSMSPFPDSANAIATEIEVSQRCALPQHSCQTLCPVCADHIVSEIEVSQRWALRQHSSKTLRPCCSNPIVAEIEVSQCWALRQHFCKPLCVLSFHVTVRQLECGDADRVVATVSSHITN